MKKKYLFIAVAVLWVFSACKEDINMSPDNIVVNKIDKTINLSKGDSIGGTCKSLILEITNNTKSENTSLIRLNNELVLCDGFDNIVTTSYSKKVIPLDKDQDISEKGEWANISVNSLDEFAGKGEKYIAYRSGVYPAGVTNYNYGWIRIELSSDKSILKIIDRAINYTENKFIKAGQIK